MMTQAQVQQTADALITLKNELKTVKRNKSGTINGNASYKAEKKAREALKAAGWDTQAAVGMVVATLKQAQ